MFCHFLFSFAVGRLGSVSLKITSEHVKLNAREIGNQTKALIVFPDNKFTIWCQSILLINQAGIISLEKKYIRVKASNDWLKSILDLLIFPPRFLII